MGYPEFSELTFGFAFLNELLSNVSACVSDLGLG
jgi:hypothetical protein